VGETEAIETQKIHFFRKSGVLKDGIEQVKSDKNVTLRERNRLEWELRNWTEEYELLRKRNALLLQ